MKTKLNQMAGIDVLEKILREKLGDEEAERIMLHAQESMEWPSYNLVVSTGILIGILEAHLAVGQILKGMAPDEEAQNQAMETLAFLRKTKEEMLELLNRKPCFWVSKRKVN